jgi:hypothetical protein
MLEFMLSRLVMSICALLVLLVLAPVCVQLPSGITGQPDASLEELESRFEEVAAAPGEATLVVEMGDYLGEGDLLFLYPSAISLVGNDGQSSCSLPGEFQITTEHGDEKHQLDKAVLDQRSCLHLSKHRSEDGMALEAHIENLAATSATLSPNTSTSSRVL